MADLEPLPVPEQLQKQLAKCKSIRKPDYHKSREKTPAVRFALAFCVIVLLFVMVQRF